MAGVVTGPTVAPGSEDGSGVLPLVRPPGETPVARRLSLTVPGAEGRRSLVVHPLTEALVSALHPSLPKRKGQRLRPTVLVCGNLI